MDTYMVLHSYNIAMEKNCLELQARVCVSLIISSEKSLTQK